MKSKVQIEEQLERAKYIVTPYHYYYNHYRYALQLDIDTLFNYQRLENLPSQDEDSKEYYVYMFLVHSNI